MQLLDPRPVYMDPPRVKPYKRRATGAELRHRRNIKSGFGPLFYCSAAILIVVSVSLSVYAYVLRVRYKSEKFRCETPFFHRQQQQQKQQRMVARGGTLRQSPATQELDEDSQ